MNKIKISNPRLLSTNNLFVIKRMVTYIINKSEPLWGSNLSDIEFKDIGTDSDESVDYPDYANKLVKVIQNNSYSFGVLICGTGIGMSMSANRTKDIRAALCLNTKMAELARQHNNANILVLGSRLISVPEAIKCLLVFLNTKFEGGRHQGRLNKFNNVDYNIT